MADKKITAAEVGQHKDDSNGYWLIVENKVYDVTSASSPPLPSPSASCFLLEFALPSWTSAPPPSPPPMRSATLAATAPGGSRATHVIESRDHEQPRTFTRAHARPQNHAFFSRVEQK